jgi:hypothetical protein
MELIRLLITNIWATALSFVGHLVSSDISVQFIVALRYSLLFVCAKCSLSAHRMKLRDFVYYAIGILER